eukprot:gnl/MRDRNA2_/MRDRNA2_134945_c0_seq1.p1 gnl/MRDRNA2_/MRDRNA2_134945_c0~~gnl/MRDRNA2_/MRDRNA2_134945_c0_seq1.p1  ORF type:complete len:790 (-),score=115.93 gnl/MRDRNA2_/MRDRNA2_134945_c0_seq1:108-2477(-)
MMQIKSVFTAILWVAAKGDPTWTKLKPWADGKWYDLPKDFNIASTICQRPANPNLADCEGKWLRFGVTCYLLIHRASTYSEATSRCADHSGSLVRIASAEENEFVRGRVCGSRMCWIGLTKRPGTVIWEWQDGPQATYTNWQEHEPSDENTEYRQEGGQLGVSERAAVMHFSFGYMKGRERNSWADGKWLDAPASYDEPFPICEKPVSTKGCDEIGWDGFEGSCYKLIEVHSNYAKAEQACQDASSHLVSISSGAEQQFVQQLCGKKVCWLGLREHNYTETWFWADGTKLAYENWSPGEPNNYDGEDENVVIMNQKFHWDFVDPDAPPDLPEWVDGTWYDAPENFNLPQPICEYDQVDHQCEPGWVMWQDSCYLLIEKSVPYGEAVQLCDDHAQSKLVSITSFEENLIVQKLCGKRICWLGLREDPHSEVWRWTDGTKPTYANWHPGEPNNLDMTDEKVAMMHFSWNVVKRTLKGEWARGEWFDVPAIFDQPNSICEKRMFSKGCSAGWLQFGESCYRLMISKSSYGEAKRRCQGVGAHLVSIQDQDEQDYVQRLCGERMCWLGLQEHKMDGSPKMQITDGITEEWYWIDGSPKYFRNWAAGEPNNAGGSTDENAAVLNFNFQWAIKDATAWGKQGQSSTTVSGARSWGIGAKSSSSLQNSVPTSSSSLRDGESSSGSLTFLTVTMALYVLVYVAVRFAMVKVDFKAPEEVVVVAVSFMVAVLGIVTGGSILGSGSFSAQILLLFLYGIAGSLGITYLRKTLRRQRMFEVPLGPDEIEAFESGDPHPEE